MRVRLGILFANVIKLIMDPAFFLHYFFDLTDSGALHDLAEGFQSRKVNILSHHNQSDWVHSQMQNVSHLVQLLELEMPIGLDESFKDHIHGLECWCSAKSFKGP